jgi:hypothetical protein
MNMKTTYWVLGIVVAGLLAFAGCSKSNKPVAQHGAVDIMKFRQAFPTPTPDQQNNISKVTQGVRYRLYPRALEALDKLNADPSLTDAQKKAVSDMIEGINQAMTNAPAPPAQ